jgi:tetratricopeptide (TPR) repeat protein
VHFGLGYLYWKSQRYDEAKNEFQAELALDPRHGQAMAYLGDVEFKQNNLDRAISLLQEAISIKNDIRIAHMDLGTIFSQQKKYPQAVKALQRAIELDPKRSDAHYRLANVYKAMGNTIGAQEEFAKVRNLQENPKEDMVRKMSSSPPPLNQP